jgi:hypothetical protein
VNFPHATISLFPKIDSNQKRDRKPDKCSKHKLALAETDHVMMTTAMATISLFPKSTQTRNATNGSISTC